MEPEEQKFGRGPRELTGAVDLINHYKLLPHHEFFCKKSLPVSIADTHYLHNVVGDTEIRKGEGIQLDQLTQNPSYSRDRIRILPFNLDVLKEAFHLRETAPIELPLGEKGIPTIPGKSKSESNDKEKKHKKHKDRDKDKDSIRSTNIGIKTVVKTRIKKKEMGIRILVLIIQRNTMTRKGSMMVMEMLMTFTNTKRARRGHIFSKI